MQPRLPSKRLISTGGQGTHRCVLTDESRYCWQEPVFFRPRLFVFLLTTIAFSLRPAAATAQHADVPRPPDLARPINPRGALLRPSSPEYLLSCIISHELANRFHVPPALLVVHVHPINPRATVFSASNFHGTTSCVLPGS